MQKTQIDREKLLLRRRRDQATREFGQYLVRNIGVFSEMLVADPEYSADLLSRLNPPGELTNTAFRLSRVGVRRDQFQREVFACVESGFDKMVSRDRKKLLADSLWGLLKEARRTGKRTKVTPR